MNPLSKVSLHWKLTAIMMIAATVAVFCAGIPLADYARRAMRRDLIRQADAVGEIIAQNAAPSLLSTNNAAATLLLKGLRSQESVQTATLFDLKGNVLAEYVRSNSASPTPRVLTPPPAAEHSFIADQLVVRLPMHSDDRIVGGLELRLSLREHRDHLRMHFLICAGSLLLAFAVTFAVSFRLQRLISDPILDLARLARRIGNERDYAVQAPKTCDDEIGELVDSFNGMVSEIRARDVALRQANEELERRVAARTSELQREVDERSRAEAALRRSDERFALVVRATNDVIYDWDVPGGDIWWNPSIRNTLGFAPEDIASFDDWARYLHPDDRDDILASLGRAIEDDVDSWNGEYRFMAASGGCVFVHDRAHITRDENGRATRMVGVIIDITARKRVEQELQRAVQAANDANRAKSDFLATMSHEIRTPMNGVIGCSNLLFETALTAEQRELVSAIQSSGRAMMTLINDILDFSKIEAGKMDLERTTFDFAEAVEEVAELIAPQAEAKGLEVAIGYAPDCPRLLTGDPGRVRQVLLNLVSNAVKFTTRGYVGIIVEREEAGGPHGRLRCNILDTGIGIPASKRGLLFQQFCQLDSSTTRRFGGTGLGLAISRRLVELMDGEIGVASEEGIGSTFWFALPLPDPSTVAPVEPDLASAQRLRVLVVDDLPLNRQVIGGQLAAWKIRHCCADGAAKALELLRQALTAGDPFHAAILDHLMPDMDGEMLGRVILADAELKRTRLIMLTSGGRVGSAKSFLNAGFIAYLLKPVVRPAQLLACLTRAADSVFSEESAPANSAPSPSPAAPKTEDALALPPESTRGGGRRILVAEDNAVNQRVAVKMLERLGCRVDVAADGREAVAMARRFRYDLVFMDCLMPEMDGLEAAALIRRQEQELRNGRDVPRLPIVALTANAMSGDRERCLEAGMDDHIPKPVTLATLRATLERWTPVLEARDKADD